MIKDLQHYHQKIFDYLIRSFYSFDPKNNLFILRKSDSNGRLSKGYWFLGNEKYLALSFWTGTSYKNRTPNISLILNYPELTYELVIDTRDSKVKTEFVQKTLINDLYLSKNWELQFDIKDLGNGQWKIPITGDSKDPIKTLEFFLSTLKPTIDKSLRSTAQEFQTNEIGFISSASFEYKYEEIKRRQKEANYEKTNAEELEVTGIKIGYFQGITDQVSLDVESSNKWIFITGENGAGKSCLLRALALGLVQRAKEHDLLKNKATVELKIQNTKTGEVFDHFTSNKNLSGGRRDLNTGFAAYGPIRLETTEKVTYRLSGRDSSTYGLFNYDSTLLDIEAEVKRWRRNEAKQDYNEQFIISRLESIKEVLIESIPGLGNIKWSNFNDKGKLVKTKYFEADQESGEVYPGEGVTFDQLPSGIRSMIAMVGDIIVRLFRDQQGEDDVRSLKGIVIIDEIDLHLHPKFQKKLVELLSGQFHRIQFIVSTHSPIPLLGAPENSAFVVVFRNENGSVAARTLEIDIKDLLPNAILSSPIFGFDELSSTLHKPETRFQTQDLYEDVIKNRERRKQLHEIAKKLREG